MATVFSAWSFGCLAAYLAFSGVALAIDASYAPAMLHLAGSLACLGVVRRARARRPVSRWTEIIPLFIWPFLYFELPAVMTAMGSAYHDSTVQAWELALFPTNPSRTLAGMLPWRPLSELLHVGYLAYYPAIFLPPIRLLFHEDRRALSQTILALALTYAVCWITYAFFPVQGPRYLWTAPAHIPDGPIRRLTTSILMGGSSRGAAFPSSHMAIATVQAVLATRWQPRVGIVLWIIAGMIGVSAVYGGFHYGVDILAGLVLGLAAGLVVLRLAGHASP